jgi:hypothetical protein
MPYFARCKDPDELWVPIVEKAYAKIHGSYESLIGGYIDQGLNDLSGLCSEQIVLRQVFPTVLGLAVLVFLTELVPAVLDISNRLALTVLASLTRLAPTVVVFLTKLVLTLIFLRARATPDSSRLSTRTGSGKSCWRTKRTVP